MSSISDIQPVKMFTIVDSLLPDNLLETNTFASERICFPINVVNVRRK